MSTKKKKKHIYVQQGRLTTVLKIEKMNFVVYSQPSVNLYIWNGSYFSQHRTKTKNYHK